MKENKKSKIVTVLILVIIAVAVAVIVILLNNNKENTPARDDKDVVDKDQEGNLVFGNNTIKLVDGKYVVLDKNSKTLQTFDAILSLEENENRYINCILTLKGNTIKTYNVAKNKFLDIDLKHYTVSNNSIVELDEHPDYYNYGSLYFYTENNKKMVYDLNNEIALDLGAYEFNIVGGEYYTPLGDEVLFINYKDGKLSAIDINGKEIVNISLDDEYDEIKFVPNKLSNKKYYFQTIKYTNYDKNDQKYGIINGNGKVILQTSKELIPAGFAPVSVDKDGNICINGDGKVLETYDYEGNKVK